MGGGRAGILYSDLSGEEILQQWLDSHPEVVGRFVEQERQKKKRRGKKRGGKARKIEGEGKEEGGKRKGEAVVDKQERGVENHQMYLSYNPTADAATAPVTSTGPQADDIPLYLEPYRAVLPPSLMSATSRTAYPHTRLPGDASEWG